MRRLLDVADRVAGVDSTVLITGETGVGKEWLARYMHRRSCRERGPFIAVNCGALPDALLENELFGHRRGAFTGAHSDSAGLFEAAHGGIIFLDEIGELPRGMQVKLLRVLQEREVRRLGDTRTRSVDVRVMAATNRDLEVEVKGGRFRQDLFYRLNVVALRIPPLRDRPDDVRALVDIMLPDIARRVRRDVNGHTPRALAQLLAYRWPGNVRELQNVLERACAFAGGNEIDLEDLPEHVRLATAMPRESIPDLLRPLWQVERDYILCALQRNDGNRTRTAQQLEIGTKTLYRKLKEYERREAAGAALTHAS